jgi:peptidyl-prolyl cis-trans isomerase C
MPAVRNCAFSLYKKAQFLTVTGIIDAMSTLKQLTIGLFLLSLVACSGTTDTPTAPAVSQTSIPLTATSSSATATLPPMALTVNGEGISIEAFNAELTRYQAAQAALGLQTIPEQAAASVSDDLIAQLLLAQGAKEAGFSLDAPALQARMDALSAQLGGADKLSAWQQAHGYSDESFRVALQREAAAAWMRDKIISTVPTTAEQVHIRQILLYNQANAQKYFNLLEAGSKFDTIALQVDPVTRGDIGWIPRGYLSEKAIEDAAFALEPDKYSAIIQDKVGFHILELIERQPARALSPDQRLTLQTRALSDWITNQRQKSSVVLAPK